MKIVLWVILGVIVFGFVGFFYLGQKSQKASPLGLIDGKLAQCPASPNCVSSELGTDDKKFVLSFSPEHWEKLADAIAATGGVVTSATDSYIAATYTSKIFKFVDDLEFRKADDTVHVRSASRVGYSDRGENAARVDILRTVVENY